MVFQSYAIFPHLNVRDNIAYGLRTERISAAAREQRVAEALAMIKLETYGERRAHQLSGGERQRVALARALVKRPKVLLLDEPLGALDKRLRQQMQIELKQIQREVGITTVFVTHDQEEALTLSDRIAIFDEGKVVQAGSPHEVYERPATAFAANFLGDANFFEGKVLSPGRVAAEGGELATDDPLTAPGSTVILAVRPEKIFLARPESPAAPGNRLMGQLGQAVYSGMSTIYKVSVGGRELTVFAQNRSGQDFVPGDAVRLEWSPAHSVVVRP
jgi:ABC-type Fe3+/spermidine/putrescine transport system ATPase subunit